MYINKNRKVVIIGNFNDINFINILKKNNFLSFYNPNIYMKKDNNKVMQEILFIMNKNKLKSDEYIYFIKIGNKLVILEYKKINQRYYFYKVDNLGNGFKSNIEIYKFLNKNLDKFIDYRINKVINILYCVIGAVRTMNKTFDNIYHNVINSFSTNKSVYFYLKLDDIGPKNNKGVNYVYHKNNKDNIDELLNKYDLDKEVIYTEFNLGKEDIEKYVNDRKRFINWMSSDEVLVRIMNFHYNLKKTGEQISKKKYDLILYTRPDIKFPDKIPFYLNYSQDKIYDLSKSNFNDFTSVIPHKLMKYYFIKPFELYGKSNNKFEGPEEMLNYCIKKYYVKTDYFAKIERNQGIKKYNICFQLVGNIDNEKQIKSVIKIMNKSTKYYNLYLFGYLNNQNYSLFSLLKNINFTKLRINKTENNFWLQSQQCYKLSDSFSKKENIQYDLIINMNINFELDFFLENEIYYCINKNKLFFKLQDYRNRTINPNFIAGPKEKMNKILNYYNEINTKENNKKIITDTYKFTFYLYNICK